MYGKLDLKHLILFCDLIICVAGYCLIVVILIGQLFSVSAFEYVGCVSMTVDAMCTLRCAGVSLCVTYVCMHIDTQGCTCL